MLFDRGGSMRRTRWATGVGAGLLALLAAPAAALADGGTLQDAVAGKLPSDVAINSVWVLVAGILVVFMQAGFPLLGIGFFRGEKPRGGGAEELVQFSIFAPPVFFLGVCLPLLGGDP